MDRTAPQPPVDVQRPKLSQKVLRFHAAERSLHWSLSIPFLVCLVSGVLLAVVYNPAPLRPLRLGVSWVHRVSAVYLIVLPVWAVIRNIRGIKVHFQNVKEAWTWTLDDLKWMALMPLSSLGKRVDLPEQGKFNTGQKLNFVVSMTAYPIFIVTGVVLWLSRAVVVAWVVHVSLAFLIIPLVLVHIYMATVNPDTRAALRGMITGYVDRQWLKHHHARWYRANFTENPKLKVEHGGNGVHPLQRPARVRCPSCAQVHRMVSWARLLRRVLEPKPLLCPTCGTDMRVVEATITPDLAEVILRHLEQGAVREPLVVFGVAS